MILLLDTATPTARLTVVTGERIEFEWLVERELAKGLIGWIESSLNGLNKGFTDIQGIGVFKGPGSFTGLRIGMTVVNTLADSLQIPIVTTGGEDWQANALERLRGGQNDGVALPHYDRDANITKPRK